MALSLFGGEEKVSNSADATAGKKRILLCEDDNFFSQALTLILSSAGYEILAAADGQQGVAKLREVGGAVDLILCDIMMPVLDGFGVLREVKHDPTLSKIPFVFLTGVSDMDSMDRATELGALDYFIKANTGLPKIVDTVKKYI